MNKEMTADIMITILRFIAAHEMPDSVKLDLIMALLGVRYDG